MLDADLLCDDPPSVVAEWCSRMELPYDADALSWEPGMQDDWELWGDWHGATARSNGFEVLDPPPPPPTPDEPRLYSAYQFAEPIYRAFRSEAIGQAVERASD